MKKHLGAVAAVGVLFAAIVAYAFTPAQRIRRLYRGILYREPESGGAKSWLENYHAKSPTAYPFGNMEASIKGSAEALGLTPDEIARRKQTLKPYLLSLFARPTP